MRNIPVLAFVAGLAILAAAVAAKGGLAVFTNQASVGGNTFSTGTFPTATPVPNVIAFDAASSCTPVTASSFTWSHTTSGSNRILIVGVALRNNLSQTVSSVAYAGTSLTLIGVQNQGTIDRVELWRLVAPATGANNVVVTLSASAKTACGAVSLTGVDQTSPIDQSGFALGTNSTPSVGVTTVANNAWLVDAVAFFSTGIGLPSGSAGLGQTERWSGYTETGGGAINVRGKGSTKGPVTPAGAVVMDWTLGASTDWAIGAVALKPAP